MTEMSPLRRRMIEDWPALNRADADIGFAARFDWLGCSGLGHELSHQYEACDGGRRDSGPRSSIAPPQSGQISST